MMAITPQKAKQIAKGTPLDTKRLEKIVDAALIEAVREGNNHATVSAYKFPDRLAIETIIAKYNKLGWKASYESGDQRDEPYVYFEARKQQ